MTGLTDSLVSGLVGLFPTLLFGLMMLALVLGLTYIVMAIIVNKSGAEGMKQRIEYGFFGVTGLAITGLFAYLLA